MTHVADGFSTVVEFPSSHIGALIGRGGQTIVAVQRLSNCRISISKSSEGQTTTRQVSIDAATASALDAARALLTAIKNGEDISSWDETNVQRAVDGAESENNNNDGAGASISTLFSQLSFGDDVDPILMASVMVTRFLLY
jgi:predicted RNA-binding protein YlqC (UPF0109 family)